jgi:membrane fusion protein (multidrug efflux system)
VTENQPNPEKKEATRSFDESLKILTAKMAPWLFLIASIIGAITIFSLIAHFKKQTIEENKRKEEQRRKEVIANVKTWKVKPSKLINNIKLPGIVQPWENLILESEVSGRIMKIEKEEGAYVNKGDTIACIEDRDYRSALARAKADLALATQNYERTKSLKKQGAVPQANLDRDQASYQRAKANLETAAHNFERCTIKAPFAGVINKRYVAPGTFAKQSSKIIELVDISKVKVDIGIPEADVDKVKKLKEAEVTVKALENKNFTGKKIFLSVKPSDQALIHILRLSIDNKEKLLTPGMFVEADIVREIYNEAVSAPLFAVIARDNDTFCYVVKDNKAVRQDVDLGIMKGRFVHIKSGLKSGDKLIVLGQRQIDDDQKVNIIDEINDPAAVFKTQ